MSFHFHGPGFAEVITGRKQFFLYPPDLPGVDAETNSVRDKDIGGMMVPVPPNLTMSQWVDDIYPTLQRRKYLNPAFDACVESTVGSGDSGSRSSELNEGDEWDIYNFDEPKGTSFEQDSGASTSTTDDDTHSHTHAATSGVIVSPPAYIESFYECVLEPGDMLYFPDKWQHATLNLDKYNLFASVFLDVQLMK